MRDNPEVDPAEGVQKYCKKNSPSVLSCIGQEKAVTVAVKVGTVHSGRDGEGPVLPRKPKESGRRGSCEIDFVSQKSSGCA